MLDWKVSNGVISQLHYGNDQLIYPWGVETADSWGFFSLENGIGYRNLVSCEKFQHNSHVSSASLRVEMPEGNWELLTCDKLQKNSIERYVHLKTLSDSWFMDFVMRFRFQKKFFNYAEIAGLKIEHQNSNIYHQFQVNEATLVGNKYRMKLNIIETLYEQSFACYLYVRDYNDEWVVHVRLLPTQNHKMIIKLCNKWTKTKPLPLLISDEILRKNWLRKKLLYRSERNPYQNKVMRLICPNAFPLVNLKPEQELMIKAECKIYEV